MKIARATVLDDSLIIGPFRSDGGTQLPTVKMCIRFTDSKGEQWGSIYWPKLITIKERTTISLKVTIVFENHQKCRIWVFQFWHF